MIVEACGARHATGLIVNALTKKPGETTEERLLRNDFAPSLRSELQCSLLVEFELQRLQAQVRNRSFACLNIELLVAILCTMPRVQTCDLYSQLA